MNLANIEKIIDKIEGAGTYALDTPLAFRYVSTLVNSFDFSGALVRYDKSRIVFKDTGLYYIIPVAEVKTEPEGTAGVDYDFVNGKYWIYMKPSGSLTYDILCTNGIGAIKFYQKVSGGSI